MKVTVSYHPSYSQHAEGYRVKLEAMGYEVKMSPDRDALRGMVYVTGWNTESAS